MAECNLHIQTKSDFNQFRKEGRAGAHLGSPCKPARNDNTEN
jgi:hypothetical protein